MNRKLFCFVSIFCFIVSVCFAKASPDTTNNNGCSAQIRSDHSSKVSEAYGKLPLSFEANQGQTNSQVKFLSRGRNYRLFLTADAAVLALRPGSRGPGQESEKADRNLETIVRLKLVGANPVARVVGLEELPGRSNYFIGNDPQKWRTEVPNYARVEYREVYPGVSLVYHGKQRQLEYDFVVAPGADPRRIKLAVKGVKRLRIDAHGDLILSTAGGEIRQQKPIVYQEVGGVKKAIDGRYVLKGKQRVGFQVAKYDTRKPLVIDPMLIYATYLGGSSDDFIDSITVDGSGNAYLTGETASVDFPTANPYQPNLRGSFDAFVTKLNAAGSALVYSTYLGGSNSDSGSGIAVNSAGNAFVTGFLVQRTFPP